MSPAVYWQVTEIQQMERFTLRVRRTTFLVLLLYLTRVLSMARTLLVKGRVSVKAVKRSTVSTGNLKRFHAVQLRPINRVVYPGSLGGKPPWNPRLDIGFTLRCFQRLSVPDMA